MTYHVLLYYKYQKIADPKAFRERHLDFCRRHDLYGRILAGEEGLNGTVAGKKKDTDAYKAFVRSIEGFEDIVFKEHQTDILPFASLQVKTRPEIVTLGEDIGQKETARHLSPKEFHTIVEQSQEDDSIIILDARNKIESTVGRFKGAMCPDITFYREFPKAIQDLDLKGKKVAMYCTGGIRCEKASALVKEQGAKEVYQLEGGIYEYCREFPNGYFEGSCFVFDRRMQIAFTESGPTTAIPKDKIISHCAFCEKTSNRVINDERRAQRYMLVCCEACDKERDISRVRYGEEKRGLISDVTTHKE